jgi:uncharacterized protein (TIGR02145 family)
MVSNLRYAGDTTNPSTVDEATVIVTLSNDATVTYRVNTDGGNSYARPEIYTGPRGSNDYTDTATSGGFYGYLYNWCAAMGGQSNVCSSSTNNPSYNETITICPKNWRLPKGGAGATATGSASTTVSEFARLDIALGGTGQNRSGSGVSDSHLRGDWMGMYSGMYGSGLGYQGSEGYYWSSTAGKQAGYAYYLVYNSSYVYPASDYFRSTGHAVRCVISV